MDVTAAYIAIGGNRNPAAADWNHFGSPLLAFGADNGIALWDPQDEYLKGIQTILNGHTKAVNAIKFFPAKSPNVSILLSGSSDHSIRIWRIEKTETIKSHCLKVLSDHASAVTKINILLESNIFASGASDGTVKIWRLTHNADLSEVEVELRQTITLAPRYFPLNLALAALDETSVILAVAGTKAIIQIFVSCQENFELVATLTGHEGWIRALDFTRETVESGSDLLLSSASQDKYIRLWRIHKGDELPVASSTLNDRTLGGLGKSLSNKAHWFDTGVCRYSVTFEALLLGHEDWIYTASWRRRGDKLQLLSASEDNSLAIWESDPTSGVWICTTRLGEISAQKGSTSATGSAGGFWIGLWSPDGDTVVSLGRTGSWRKWNYSGKNNTWAQQVAITGHVKEVKGVAWSRDGSYFLTTGSDQTTRLFSRWKDDTRRSSWHEFSRPQIHGYDLNCIETINNFQFISGADEKLLRVFDEPKGVADMLRSLCGIQTSSSQQLPDAANIPVLGLSNKAIQAVGDDEVPGNDEDDEREAVDPSSIVKKSTLDFKHPPFEDHLARHLLWPETEKLYGHGYEISALTVSKDGSLIATACRASSIDHAVIRLYDTKEWLEVKPPLKAHSLTVTALQFSFDDRYLVSVGRDRQWALWERGADEGSYALKFSNPKGHTRMILSACWIPSDRATFLTAGRDKLIKIWQLRESGVDLVGTVSCSTSVTAIGSSDLVHLDQALFAFGMEGGGIGIATAPRTALDQVQVTVVPASQSPAKAINQIVWRPRQEGAAQQIAVASDDASVRVYNIWLDGTKKSL